jgi:hypothetical protein
VDQARRGLGDEHLAAVPRSGYAGGAVDVEADVALLRHLRRAGVDPHAHRDHKLLLRLAGSGERSGRGREGDEEGITLRVDLDPPVAGEGVAQEPAVIGERMRITVLAELV